MFGSLLRVPFALEATNLISVSGALSFVTWNEINNNRI
jgi:hypothetical protein